MFPFMIYNKGKTYLSIKGTAGDNRDRQFPGRTREKQAGSNAPCIWIQLKRGIVKSDTFLLKRIFLCEAGCCVAARSFAAYNAGRLKSRKNMLYYIS